MKGLLFLLCCIEIMGALLCGAQNTTQSISNQIESKNTETEFYNVSNTASIPTSKPTSLRDTQSSAAVAGSPTSPRISPSPGPQSTTPSSMFFKKDCLPVFMVTGGLMIACTILLVSTLLLVCKVCQLSRRIKELSSNVDLINSSEHWEGTGKKDKNKSEAETKETTVLMAEMSQTQEEVRNGTTSEEEGKADEDGQTGEDEKEAGDTSNSEEASATPATAGENSPSSKPQEEEQSTKDTAASTSEGTEEAKDVV